MIASFLDTTQNISVKRQRETFSTYELRISFAYDWNVLSRLVDNCKSVAPRDRWELRVIIDADSECITDASKKSKDQIETFFNKALDDTKSLSVEFTINKLLDNYTLSTYSLQSFSDYLASESLKNIFRLLNSNFSEKLVFEVFESVSHFGSNSILFFSNGEVDTSLIKVTPPTVIDTFKDLCSHNLGTVNLTPVDLFLVQRSELPVLNKVFDDLCTVLSLGFIADRTEVDEQNDLRYKINGYKSFELQQNFKSLEIDQFDYLYKIFQWIYEERKSVDKIGLVRNVFSLHYDNGKLDVNKDCWFAIKSNYEIYLKDNISQYIEVKNKIVEFIEESSAKTNSIVESFSESFRKNTIAILTFFVSVYLVKGLKSDGFGDFLTIDNLMVLGVLTVLSFIWLYISREDIERRTNHRLDDFKKLLQNNYKKVLAEEEINQAVNPVLASNRAFLKDQITFYSKWWISVNILVLVTFIACLGVKITKVKDKSKENISTNRKVEAQSEKTNSKKAEKKVIVPEMEAKK